MPHVFASRTALLGALLLLFVALPAHCERQLKQRERVPALIVNGTDAPKGRYRYIASLRSAWDGWMHFCGGALVHPSAVLTAAHCVRNHITGADYPADLHFPLVRLGGWRRDTDGPGDFDLRAVVKTVVHPSFKTGFAPGTGPTQDFMTYDAALLILDKPSSMPTVRLPPQKSKPGNPLSDFTPVTAMGWGYTDANRAEAETLQQLHMQLMPLETCQSDFGSVTYTVDGAPRRVTYNWLNNSLICAARDYPNTFNGICGGDSGSPLVKRGTAAGGSEDLLVGVASFASSKCGQYAEKPSAFTDAAFIAGWVERTLGRLLPDASGEASANKQLVGSVNGTSLLGFDGRAAKVQQGSGSILHILSWPGWRLTATLSRVGPSRQSMALSSVLLRGPRSAAKVAVNRGRFSVTTNSKPLPPSQERSITGGSVSFASLKARSSRSVTVKLPGLSIRIVQPWSKLKGLMLNQLSVTVTTAAGSKRRLGGKLGATMPGPVADAG